ncbi:hypothetical protein FMEAI12_4320039 [Parafrankia sp. Ea1.12]|nr:hypothetical protein FMEAI12_4320039 [Parafrankia sp. Ea1.12]
MTGSGLVFSAFRGRATAEPGRMGGNWVSRDWGSDFNIYPCRVALLAVRAPPLSSQSVMASPSSP